ncbi:Hpt domain-containing protein [Desulforamulus aquiferis]|uniref:Hpt domain-containing protein n=1 Tax=Desulforamulus aquiferis TaxID=1397668 RepID=A0AAW7ZH31_9FIRM|nr:Hpt domain-containing protein [Desulforamulus aquiferis]MDO7788504.1 Hpt domain-containing protein [Desulforamulus aquiferis]
MLESNKLSIELLSIDKAIWQNITDLVSGDDPEFLINLISTYLSSSQFVFNNLEKSIMSDSTGELKDKVHALKSASANIGALGLVNICGNFEAVLGSGGTQDLSCEFAKIKAAYISVCQELQSLKKDMIKQGKGQ